MANRHVALAGLLVLLGCGGGSPKLIDDTNPPDLAVTSPPADGSCGATSCSGGIVTAASPSPFVLSGTVSDASAFTVRVTVRGPAGVVAGPADAAVAGGAWSFPWTVPAGVGGSTFTVEVVATDDKSNTVTRTRTLLVDNVLPTATFASPQSNPLVGTATVDVSGQVADAGGFGIALAEISLDGATFSPLALSGVQFATTLPVPAVDAVAQTVTVRITDLAGNVGTSTAGFVADRVGPTLAIAVPAADASCAGAACTGGVVNLAAGASYAISGTGSDPGGLRAVEGLVARILDGAAEVAGTRTVLAGGSWSYAWSGPPADAGKAYTFELTGVDVAGNQAVVTRALWVDRVAPTVTLNRSGQRLVSRTATLATFSEPMNVASVLTATTFSPGAVSRASYGSSDGRAFGFTDPANLAAYQTYAMTVGTGAADKAGNPIAAAAPQTFLTETAAVTRIPLETDLGSFTPALPAIALDADGKPHVVYQTSSDEVAGTEPRLASWDGRGGAFPANVVRRSMGHTGPAWTAGKAVDLAVYANPTDSATLALSPGLKALVSHTNGAATAAWQVKYALSADRVTWLGQGLAAGEAPTVVTTTNRDMEPCFDDVRGACFILVGAPPPSRILANTLVAPDPLFDLRSYTANPMDFTSLAFNTADQHRCAATLVPGATSGFDVAYADARRSGPTGVASLATVAPVSGRTQIQTLGFLPCFPPPCLPQCVAGTLGSGFVAHDTATTTGIFPLITTTHTLSVSCNGDPTGGGTWRTSTASLISGRLAVVSRLATARSSSAFVVAAALSNSTIRVFKAANDTCAANPALVEATATIPGREPAVAVDDAGNVWVASVSTDPLTLGQLFVDKVSFP